MPLISGSRLGPYEVLTAIGAGGMGEVYRARDTRLGRDVAIKILTASLSANPEGKQRFEREARVVASLNHPNICTLHDIGHQDGVDFLVMECLEGETLAKWLTRGPLPQEQTLAIAAQIADALDKAHRRGVVHRDLKPGNVMLTKSGAKLLDFGLAKATVAEAMSQETLSEKAPLSAPGTIVGTLQYMSPEQTEGREADARSDIFAFGAVLYEMITGRRAFEGKSRAAVISAILVSQPPPVSQLQPLTPPALDRFVKSCLEKDPDDRPQSAHDLVLGLKWIGESATSQVTQAVARGAVPLRGTHFRRWLPWAVAALFAIVAGALWFAHHAGAAASPVVTRFTIALPETDPLYRFENGTQIALSPDGTQLVYTCQQGASTGSTRLCRHTMDQLDIKPMPGTEGGRTPFFSPDGNWLGFSAGGKLKKIPVGGGSPLVICDTVRAIGPVWNADNSIAFSPDWHTGIMQVPAAGGRPEFFVRPDLAKNEASSAFPQMLHSPSDALLYTVSADSIASFNDAQIVVQPLEGKLLTSKEPRSLLAGGTDARYLPTGYLVYGYAGSLWAARLDPRHRKLEGAATPVVDGVYMDGSSGAVFMAFSDTGSLAYAPGGMFEGDSTLLLVDRGGVAQTLLGTHLRLDEMRLSPDGRRLAVHAVKANDDIHVYDMTGGTLSRFTFEGGDKQAPVWTPDGSRVFYSSARGAPASIYWKSVDGAGAPQLLVKDENQRFPSAISPDGKFLLLTEKHPTTGSDLWLASLDAASHTQPKPWIRTPFEEITPAFSPDGRYVAYASNDSGDMQIFVVHFPDGGGKRQVSKSGGTEPLWAANGKELFYRNRNKMMAVDVATQPVFNAGSPRLLFEGKYNFGGPLGPQYAVMPDGQHFIMVTSGSHEPLRRINVVINWFEELKRLVPLR